MKDKILIQNYNLEKGEYELECHQIFYSISYEKITKLVQDLPIDKVSSKKLTKVERNIESLKNKYIEKPKETYSKYSRFPARIITDELILSRVDSNNFVYWDNKPSEFLRSLSRRKSMEINIENIKKVFGSYNKKRFDTPPIPNSLFSVLFATLMISLIPIVNIIFILISFFSTFISLFISVFLFWMLFISIFCIGYTSMIYRSLIKKLDRVYQIENKAPFIDRIDTKDISLLVIWITQIFYFSVFILLDQNGFIQFPLGLLITYIVLFCIYIPLSILYIIYFLKKYTQLKIDKEILVQELKGRIQNESKFTGKQYYMLLLRDIKKTPILSVKMFLKIISIITLVLEIIPLLSGFF